MNLVRKNSGQVILTILLIMVVGLTVSLAVVARSVTSVKISTQEEESQRAFSAAEAGLEESLLSGAPTSGILPNNVSYNVQFITSSSSDKFNFPEIIKKDETQPLWLVGHDASGNIIPPGGDNEQRYPIDRPVDICWESPGSGETPAMEIIILHQRTTGFSPPYQVARGAYDSDGSRRGSNNFSDVSGSSGSECGEFDYRQRVVFSDFGISGQRRVVALRLRPIYDDARVVVWGSGGGVIPVQGMTIESTGVAGTTQRKVKIFKSYPTLPPIFDFALFSGQPLIK